MQQDAVAGKDPEARPGLVTLEADARWLLWLKSGCPGSARVGHSVAGSWRGGDEGAYSPT